MRHLLPLGLLLLVPIFLAPAGSAKPTPTIHFGICVQNATSTPTPSCASTGASSSFAGANSGVPVQVTIVNSGTSSTAIGSADITLPPQLKIDTAAGAPQPDKYVSAPDTQTLSVRSVNIGAGKTFVATFFIDTGCAGSGLTWSASANTSSDLTGPNSFGSESGLSTGTSTNLSTGCHLGFATQPTDTQVGGTITDQGASSGAAIKVELYTDATGTTGMTTCPFGTGKCSVSVSNTPNNVGSLSGGSAITLQADPDAGGALTASFPSLSISGVPDSSFPAPFTLNATGESGLAPSISSNSFLITKYAQKCTGGACSFAQSLLHNGKQGFTDSFVDVSSTSGFTFMTLSPFSLSGTPDGCTGDPQLGVTGFAETDGRDAGSGTLTIRYYVSQKALNAKYGKNVGQQFIPICSGGKPVDTSTGTIHRCDDPGWENQGWLGDAIDSATGAFLGGPPVAATCNGDGFYWGILGSYQDKIPAGNPVVTNWGGQNINGQNYRFFDITIPPGWDWRSGP